MEEMQLALIKEEEEGLDPKIIDPVTWRGLGGNTLMHYAAVKGDIDLLTKFLFALAKDRTFVNMNAQNFWGETPLHRAATGQNLDGRLRIIMCLIENGCNPFSKDQDNDTFLHVYISQEVNPPSSSDLHCMAQYLIDKNLAGLFVTPGGDCQVTPLQLVVGFMEPKVETLELLYSRGVHFGSVNSEGDSLLGVAVYVGRSIEFVANLISKFKSDPFHLNKKKESLLHLAAQSWSVELLEFLLIAVVPEVNVNGKDSRGRTPLHAAVHEENRESGSVLEKCRRLINYGANVNSKTKNNETPLHLAVLGKDKVAMLQVFKLLVDNGANMLTEHRHFTFLHEYVLQKDTPTPSEFHLMVEYLVSRGEFRIFNIRRGRESFTPLQWGIRNIEVEDRTLELLNDKRVKFDILDYKQNSILVYAIEGGRSTKLLSKLINKFKVDYKTLNKRESSMLHHAAAHGSVEALKFFLELGGLEVNGEDTAGDTPLHCVTDNKDLTGTLERCKILIDKGADTSKTDKAGQTALDWLQYREYDADDKEEILKILCPAGGKEKGESSVLSQGVCPTSGNKKRKRNEDKGQEDILQVVSVMDKEIKAGIGNQIVKRTKIDG